MNPNPFCSRGAEGFRIPTLYVVEEILFLYVDGVIFTIFTSAIFFQLGKNIVDYQNQAKRLFKTLTATSPIKCSIESGPYLFQ